MLDPHLEARHMGVQWARNSGAPLTYLRATSGTLTTIIRRGATEVIHGTYPALRALLVPRPIFLLRHCHRCWPGTRCLFSSSLPPPCFVHTSAIRRNSLSPDRLPLCPSFSPHTAQYLLTADARTSSNRYRRKPPRPLHGRCRLDRAR